MNIFVLDKDPVKAAKYHCDKHVVKMTLEYAQIICTVAHKYNKKPKYRQTHKNHPCVIWASTSRANLDWLFNLFCEVSKEYTRRYKKNHKSFSVGTNAYHLVKRSMPRKPITPFALAMPEKYRLSDPVKAYRFYYCGKKHWAVWKFDGEPDWFSESIVRG